MFLMTLSNIILILILILILIQFWVLEQAYFAQLYSLIKPERMILPFRGQRTVKVIFTNKFTPEFV